MEISLSQHSRTSVFQYGTIVRTFLLNNAIIMQSYKNVIQYYVLGKEVLYMKKFIQEFKEFAIGGNLVDMAIGVIVGGAFNSVISSLVADVFTPLLSMLFGGQVDFAELTLGQVQIGNFINTIISFLLTALCLFSVIKALNAAKAAMKKEEEAAAAEPAPAEPSDEVKLLTEIKDLLANK